MFGSLGTRTTTDFYTFQQRLLDRTSHIKIKAIPDRYTIVAHLVTIQNVSHVSSWWWSIKIYHRHSYSKLTESVCRSDKIEINFPRMDIKIITFSKHFNSWINVAPIEISSLILYENLFHTKSRTECSKKKLFRNHKYCSVCVLGFVCS